jgi:rfaE bifunctional protein nucleotidyltransferase chain/domain
VDFRRKILNAESLPGWREELRRRGKKLVVTNGCFDLLHPGHVSYLEQARNLGNALLVGVTGDAEVSRLKGPNRPVNNEDDRAIVMAALESVDGVLLFHEKDACHLIETTHPDIYTKGGDYTLDTLVQTERRLMDKLGIKIVILPIVAGKSTTATLARMKS